MIALKKAWQGTTIEGVFLESLQNFFVLISFLKLL